MTGNHDISQGDSGRWVRTASSVTPGGGKFEATLSATGNSALRTVTAAMVMTAAMKTVTAAMV